MVSFGRAMDYCALALTSFFLPDDAAADSGSIVNQSRPKLLLFYFLGPDMRAVLYAGFAASLVTNAVAGKGSVSTSFVYANRTTLFATVAFLSAAAFVNFTQPDLQLSSLWQSKSEDDDKNGTRKSAASGPHRSWSTTASDGLGWMGAWWVGAGNGDWFAFVGHNGRDEKTILPVSILEQMTVDRDAKPDLDVVEMEEL